MIEFKSAVWPPTLRSVLTQIQQNLPPDSFILRWAITAVMDHRLTVEATIARDTNFEGRLATAGPA